MQIKRTSSFVILISLIWVSFAFGYPTTIYDSEQNGVNPENNASSETLVLEGSGIYPREASLLDYMAKKASSPTYSVLIPDWDYSKLNVKVFPEFYGTQYISDTDHAYDEYGGWYQPFPSVHSGESISDAKIYLKPNSVSYTSAPQYPDSWDATAWYAPSGGTWYEWGTLANLQASTECHSAIGTPPNIAGVTGAYQYGPEAWFTAYELGVYMDFSTDLPFVPLPSYRDPNYSIRVQWEGALPASSTGSFGGNRAHEFGFRIYDQVDLSWDWVLWSDYTTNICPGQAGETYASFGFHNRYNWQCYGMCDSSSSGHNPDLWSCYFDATYSGDTAYRYSKNGQIQLGIFNYEIVDTGWNGFGYVGIATDLYQVVQSTSNSNHLPLAGNYENSVLIDGYWFKRGYLYGEVADFWLVPDFVTAYYQYQVTVPISSYCNIDFKIDKWNGTYEENPDRYAGLNPIGGAKLNGLSMIRVPEGPGEDGYFVFEIDDLNDDPFYLAGVYSFSITWVEVDHIYMRFSIELEWDHILAYWELPYSNDNPTFELTLEAQDYIDLTWMQGWFVDSNLVTRVYVDFTSQSRDIYFRQYEGDAPKYNISWGLPMSSTNWVMYVPHIMYVEAWFDLTIPTLTSPTFPDPLLWYEEYQTLSFSFYSTDTIGLDVGLICFTDRLAIGPNYYREMPMVGGNHYMLDGDLPAGNWTIWYLAQDNAGNWRTSITSELNISPKYPKVDSNNGTSVVVERNVGNNNIHFNITGPGGNMWEILENDVIVDSGDWSDLTDVFHNIDSLIIGNYNVTLRANNSNNHWDQHQVDVTVTGFHPDIVPLNGTNPQIEYGAVGLNLGWLIAGNNANKWNLTRNTTMNPLEDMLVAEGDWVSPQSTILYNLDGSGIGDWNFTLYANTTVDFSANMSIIASVLSLPPRVIALNGSYSTAIENQDHILEFQILGHIPGEYNVTINGTEGDTVIAQGIWTYGQIIEVELNKPNGYYNLTLWANNTNLLDGQNSTIFFAYHIPTFARLPKSYNEFPEDSQDQYITFNIYDDDPKYYYFYVDGELREIGSASIGENSIQIYVGDSQWSEGVYECNLTIRDADLHSVNASFMIDIFPTYPEITLHEDGRYFVSSTGNNITWVCFDYALEGYRLFYEGKDSFGRMANITLAEGYFTSNYAQFTFSFDGIFELGEYQIYFIANDTHGRETMDAFRLIVDDNPPSVEINVNGLISWVMIIGMFIMLIYGLKASKSRYWEDKKLRNIVVGFGSMVVAVLLVIFSFFGYLPVTSYRFNEWLAETQKNLGVYGVFILVGVSVGVAIGGYYLYRWITQRVAGEKEALG